MSSPVIRRFAKFALVPVTHEIRSYRLWKMRATHDGAETDVGKTSPSDYGEHAKVAEWLVERSADDQQQENSVVFYECTVNNMGDSNELPMNAVWLKDTTQNELNLIWRCKLEPNVKFKKTYLIGNTMDLQSAHISQNPISNEDSTEDLVKLKQERDAKPLEEHKESEMNVKRTRKPANWKVNVKKNARLKGEEYIGVGGKIVPAKKMGHPCACRMRCTDKIDEKEREKLHKAFWNIWSWQQRKQYIALSIKESPKQRTRLRNIQSESLKCRQITFTYSLRLKDECITVCKPMFLSTFAVSEKFVRYVMKKKRVSPGGIIGPDERGRHTPKTKKNENVKERVREHIRSFPTEKSTDPKDHSGKSYLDSNLNIATMHKSYVCKCKQDGVPESEIVKESYYREMFKTEFNLGFKCVKVKKRKLLSNSEIKQLK